jgi:hypothetical protein
MNTGDENDAPTLSALNNVTRNSNSNNVSYGKGNINSMSSNSSSYSSSSSVGTSYNTSGTKQPGIAAATDTNVPLPSASAGAAGASHAGAGVHTNARSNTHTQQGNGQEARVMYLCFLAQLYLEQQQGEKALQVLEGVLFVFPHSQIAATQVGRPLSTYCTSFEVVRYYCWAI